jgi:hypothetical protein
MKTSLLSIALACSIQAFAQITPEEVLAKAVNYHDPNEEWNNLKATFQFTETRPTGEDRFTTVVFDNIRSYMKINRNDENIYEVLEESCKVLAGDNDEARGIKMRNYYLYLWGLPMKLYDPNTPFDQTVNEEELNGSKCYVLRVVYEEDTWYFYIDQNTGRMLEYKFYKDEAAGKGELIKLEDEIMVGSMKISNKRSWYTLPEMKYLGTDILSKAE